MSYKKNLKIRYTIISMRLYLLIGPSKNSLDSPYILLICLRKSNIYVYKIDRAY